MDLKNKTVVLVGASGGIGGEIAHRIDERGARGIFIGRSEDKLDQLKSELKNDNHIYLACDLSKQECLDKAIADIQGATERVDVLINAVGVGVYKPIEDVGYDEWNQSFDLNVKSHFFITQGLISKLSASPNSIVLEIGSGAGVIPMASRSVYCGTKFALRGVTLSLAEEFEGSTVHFCLITLGSTLTDFGPMTRDEKQREMLSGKAYFTPEWVSKKLIDIVQSDSREREYVLYPGDYGLGKWEKPKSSFS